MLPNKNTPPHIITLVCAAALGPLAMNVFLPSLPGITAYFQTTPAHAQLSVSLYLAAVAFLQLVFGPLSDKFGRRPVILSAFCLTIVGTLICIFSPTIEWFLAGRIIQASSSAGLVLSRAIARDLREGPAAASLIAYVTMGMSLAPMIGPVIGGFLDEWYNWQASFYLVLLFGCFAVATVYLDLGETNTHLKGSFREQVKDYPDLLKSRRFWGYAATAMFSSGSFFAFLGGGTLVASKVYGLTPSQYGIYFMLISLGYLFGNFFSGKYAERIGVNRLMLSGNFVVCLGLASGILIILSGFDHPFVFFGFIFFVGLGNGMTLPSAMAGVVNVRPALAGSASGLSGSMQLGGGAVLAAIAGYAISVEGGSVPLLAMMLGSVLLGSLASLYVIWVDKQMSVEPAR